MKKNNRIFKLLTTVLCVILLISSVCVPALATERTEFGMIDEYQPNSGDPNFVADHEEVLERLFEGCINHEASIDILSYNIPVADYYSLIPALIGIYPELFFVETASGSTLNGYLATIDPVYLVSKQEADVMLEEFYAKADEYLALIDDDMDDFTKAVVLHDALVLNNVYKIGTSQEVIDSTNYTFMVEGWGRCENYVECYAFLLSKVGIKSEIINSDAMVHEWMKIKLDGSDYYYNVDITYDDPLYGTVGDLPDKVQHEYFLLSDEAIQQNHDKPHYGYEYIYDSDEAYDAHTNLHNLDNPMFYLNGALYTLYTYGRKGYIATYDHSNDSFTDKLEINDVWYAEAYGAGAAWGGNFSGIGEYKGLLYYNGENCVYCYDPVSGAKTTYIQTAMTDGRYLYGMYVKDGKIYGRASTDPNAEFEYVYLGDCIERYNVIISDGIIHGAVTADKEAAGEGETVTLTVNPDEGFLTDGVWVNNDEIEPVNGVYSFDMPDEDAVITASFDFADGVSSLAGYTVSLRDDIGVNLFMELDENAAVNEDAYMLLTVPSGANTHQIKAYVKDAQTRVINGVTCYVFSCGVSAKDMSSQITAQIISGDIQGTVYTCSVKEYAEYMLSHPEVQEYAAAADIVKAMLNYGAYSQLYFNNNIDLLANASLNDDEKALGNITAATIGVSSFTASLPEGVSFEGSSLSLKSQTVLSLYFKSDKELTFSSDTKTVTTVKSGGYQIARVTGITAKELRDNFTLTVSAGNNSGTVSYSPMNYCYNVLNDNYTPAHQDVVKALYVFWTEAKTYFNYTPVI